MRAASGFTAAVDGAVAARFAARMFCTTFTSTSAKSATTADRQAIRVHFAARTLGAFAYSNPFGGTGSGVGGGFGVRRSRSGMVSVGMCGGSPSVGVGEVVGGERGGRDTRGGRIHGGRRRRRGGPIVGPDVLDHDVSRSSTDRTSRARQPVLVHLAARALGRFDILKPIERQRFRWLCTGAAADPIDNCHVSPRPVVIVGSAHSFARAAPVAGVQSRDGPRTWRGLLWSSSVIGDSLRLLRIRQQITMCDSNCE